MVVGMKLRDRRRLARELLYCRDVPSVDVAAGTCGSGTPRDADDRRRGISAIEPKAPAENLVASRLLEPRPMRRLVH